MAFLRSRSGDEMAPVGGLQSGSNQNRGVRSFGRTAALAVCVTLCLSLGTATAAHAAPAWMQAQPATLVPQSNLAPSAERGISVERAARIARRQTGGRVLSTTRVRRSGELGVEVRLLINGSRVTKVFVDDDGEVRGR